MKHSCLPDIVFLHLMLVLWQVVSDGHDGHDRHDRHDGHDGLNLVSFYKSYCV
jgi:hypothetical protein